VVPISVELNVVVGLPCKPSLADTEQLAVVVPPTEQLSVTVIGVGNDMTSPEVGYNQM
jgi:hypothetical protein